MNTKLTLFILCTLAGLAGLLIEPAQTPPTTTEIVILRDITGNHIAKPIPGESFTPFDLDENKWGGTTLTLATISDVSYTAPEVFILKAADRLQSNELARDKEVQDFKDTISDRLNELAAEDIGKEYSSVYLSIAHELKYLSKSIANKRILIVYSDLMENDPDLSFYAPTTLHTIEAIPDEVISKLQVLNPLPDLSGIEVRLMFVAQNANADKQFRLVSYMYRIMLEQKNAIVIINETRP